MQCVALRGAVCWTDSLCLPLALSLTISADPRTLSPSLWVADGWDTVGGRPTAHELPPTCNQVKWREHSI
jgi:hypothetical protein